MFKKCLVLFVLIIFTGAPASELNIWVGGDFDSNTWNNTIVAAPNDWIDIPVYVMSGDPSVHIANLLLPLGINKTYLDQFNPGECQMFYPFTEWDIAEFTNFNDEFEPGWASLSFLGVSRIASPYSPWGHWKTPTRVMTYRVHTTEAIQHMDETIFDVIGPGYDPPQGAANASDTIGIVCYDISQQYACFVFSITAIEDEVEIPAEYFISDNYPNPFNPKTVIKYGLPEASDVVISIYDILGRTVATLVNEQQQAGYYQVTWNANNLSSGMYFYRIHAGDFNTVKKMILLK